MAYRALTPPFGQEPSNMNRNELKAYREWFLGIIKDRIAELHNAVVATQGFECWTPSFQPESLLTLGAWLSISADARLAIPNKKENTRPVDENRIKIPDWELTETTFSLAFDTGVYFGQTLVVNHPQLEWSQMLANKRAADYGHVVVAGFGSVDLNPVRVCTNFVYSLKQNLCSSGRLYELYGVWSEMIPHS